MKTKVAEFIYDGKNVTSQEAFDEGIYFDILEELGISEETITTIIKLLGNTVETYDKILSVRTGYNDLGQINDSDNNYYY